MRNAQVVSNGAQAEFAGSNPTEGIDVFFISILPEIKVVLPWTVSTCK
jgi:hypothetical protein